MTNYGREEGDSSAPRNFVDPFQFTDQQRMTKKRQSDFRKIMGNKYDCESLDVLDDPMQYFDDNEDIDSVYITALRSEER